MAMVSVRVLAAIAVVLIVVAGVGGYYLGSLVAPAKEVTTTTVTVTPPTTITVKETVRETVTTTVTVATTTTPAKPLLEGYELRVGIVLPLSGAMAAFGESGYRGALLATDEINEAGGILGAKIKLFVEDFAGDPKIAVSATEKVITTNRVHVVRGYFTSSGAMAAVPVAEKYKTPVLSIGSMAKELCEQGWKYWFKMAPNSTTYSLVTVGFLTEVLEPMLKLGRPLRVAEVHENTLMGESASKEFLRVIKEKGLKWEIVAVEAFTTGSLDFRPLLEKLKALNPDVVALTGYLTDVVLIAKQSKEIGFNPIWTNVAGAGMVTPTFIELAGENVAYWFTGTEFWYDRQYPSAAATYRIGQLFMQKTGYPPDFQSWAGYAGMYMLKEVIEKLAAENPEKVKQAFMKDDVAAIRQMIRDGLARLKLYLDWLGELYFEANGQLAWSIYGPQIPCTMLQIQPAKPTDLWSAKGLTFRTVYPPIFKAADPIIPPR